MSRSDYRITGQPIFTVHQIVAYNFRRAREETGWTQAQTGERLEPFLGTRLNQAGVSAIEKTFDSPRKRNIDVSEVVAFARCFDRPIGWFFIPPPECAHAGIEPIGSFRTMTDDLHGAELLTLILGTRAGWDSLINRVSEVMDAEPHEIHAALRRSLDAADMLNVFNQLELRRQAVQDTSLKELVTANDDVINGMARLLVELVKTTPAGMQRLKDYAPEEALELLAEGDRLVQPNIERARRTGTRPNGGLRPNPDEARPIDLRKALGIEEEA